jgi:hypothetical protein
MNGYTKQGNLETLYKGHDTHNEPHIMIGDTDGTEETMRPRAIVNLCPWPDVDDWIKVWLEGEREWISLPTDTSVYFPNEDRAAAVDWMDTGRALVERAGGQEAILTEINALSWHALPCSDVPAMQGLALGHLIKEVVTGKVRQIAWDGVLCNRYDLIGIEAEYTNGSYRHYWADTGTGLTPLVSVKA